LPALISGGFTSVLLRLHKRSFLFCGPHEPSWTSLPWRSKWQGNLLEKKLTNYWGYNTIGFFAPDPRCAADVANSLREFKEMVSKLHSTGLEVILDVVYNHTAEGNELGPTLSFKGI
jgi:pullulanase/glycogen debranching enzyme